MPNVANFRLPTGINSGLRAIRAWVRIQRWATSITLIRGGVAQDAQTMRFEITNSNALFSRAIGTPLGSFSLDSFTLYGVRGHPNPDVPDTDVKRGDRFILDNKEYSIETVIYPPGEIQAFGSVQR